MAKAIGLTPLIGSGSVLPIFLMNNSALISDPAVSKNCTLPELTLGLPAPAEAPITSTGYFPVNKVIDPVKLSLSLNLPLDSRDLVNNNSLPNLLLILILLRESPAAPGSSSV